MNCPTCNIALLISDRNGIEIDYCQKCRGVWLDRGELDKIIERAGQGAPANNRGSVQEEGDDDDSDLSSRQGRTDVGQRRQRENPISDLFDFF